MLCLCSSIILVTKNDVVRERIIDFCQKNGILLVKDTAWARYKAVNEDFIVIDSSILYSGERTCVSKRYEKKTIPIYEKGFEKCRYEYNQTLVNLTENELQFAFLTEKAIKDIRALFTDFGSVFEDSIYKFDFANRAFSYNGEYIYLTESQIEYLYEWLIMKKRDNARRGIAFTLRKKFGKEFLTGYNSSGQRRKENVKPSKKGQ